MRAQVKFLSGARAGQVEVFRKAYLSIGRHPLSDVRFDADRDLDVSSRHAAILQKGDRFHLQDFGSRNGTFVNGTPVAGEVVLADGDVVGFGQHGPTVEFRVLGADDEADTRGAEGLARRSSGRRDIRAAVPDPGGGAGSPDRSSTAVRIALEVAHQTRHLRRTTKVLLVALLVTVGAFGGLQWQSARERARELGQLTARADSLSRDARALASRFEGELQSLRDALVQSQTETEQLRRDLTAASGGDAATLARLGLALDAAERRQRGLAGAAGIDYRAIARRNQDAVAIVLVEFSERERYSATAFAVDSQGTLVTSKHVLAGEDGTRTPRRVGVLFAGSRQNFPARIVGVAPGADLAVLRVTIAGGVPRVGGLVRERDAVERGDPVAMLGYPLGFDLPMDRAGAATVVEPTLTVGSVSKVLGDILQLDGYGAPGSSGSPVLDREGRVIGVVFGGQRESQGKIVYAVPAHVVVHYLETLGIRLP